MRHASGVNDTGESFQIAGENSCQGGFAYPGGTEQAVKPGTAQPKGQVFEDTAVRMGVLERDVTAFEGHAISDSNYWPRDKSGSSTWQAPRRATGTVLSLANERSALGLEGYRGSRKSCR